MIDLHEKGKKIDLNKKKKKGKGKKKRKKHSDLPTVTPQPTGQETIIYFSVALGITGVQTTLSVYVIRGSQFSQSEQPEVGVI